MIYAIRAVGTKFIKIGYVAADEGLKCRIKTMQTGCPYELLAIAYAPGSLSDEKAIHKRLKKAEQHWRGEWFLEAGDTITVIWELRERQEVKEHLEDYDRNPEAFAPTTQIRGAGRLARALAARPEQITGAATGRSEGNPPALPVG